MEPNPNSHPILAYVLDKFPSLGIKSPSTTSTDTTTANAVATFDIEQPEKRPEGENPVLSEWPRLTDAKLLSSMSRAIYDVAQTRSVIQILGPPPDHELVDKAKVKIGEIETNLSKKLEEIVRSSRPEDMDRLQWRSYLAGREQQCRQEAEKEKGFYESVLQLDEMHNQYEKLLKDAEERLVAIYEKGDREVEESATESEDGNEQVVGILQEASLTVLERVDLSNKRLKFLPEAFGKINGMRVLNLSSNLLEVVPDSVAGLKQLEELNLSSNLLRRLPDSIGLLPSLKLLDVSGNKLEFLPDSILHLRSLVELNASFNHLTYLPTNIGHSLANLRKLCIHLNKIRSLPSSIGEMRSLRYLDAHFNELHGIPLSIGNLKHLEYLNLSSNFSDLTDLPESLGDLKNLKELDLSNNQIRALPDSFARLANLSKLNLDQNPLVIPPMDVVRDGVDAIKAYMSKRWLDLLAEEERRNALEVQEPASTGWLTRSTSWVKNQLASLSQNMSGHTSPRSPRDSFLDQQL